MASGDAPDFGRNNPVSGRRRAKLWRGLAAFTAAAVAVLFVAPQSVAEPIGEPDQAAVSAEAGAAASPEQPVAQQPAEPGAGSGSDGGDSGGSAPADDAAVPSTADDSASSTDASAGAEAASADEPADTGAAPAGDEPAGSSDDSPDPAAAKSADDRDSAPDGADSPAPPVLSELAATRTGEDTAEVTVTADREGEVYYLLGSSGGKATVGQMENRGTDAALMAGVNRVAVSGLESSGVYTVSLLAKNSDAWATTVDAVAIPAYETKSADSGSDDPTPTEAVPTEDEDAPAGDIGPQAVFNWTAQANGNAGQTTTQITVTLNTGSCQVYYPWGCPNANNISLEVPGALVVGPAVGTGPTYTFTLDNVTTPGSVEVSLKFVTGTDTFNPATRSVELFFAPTEAQIFYNMHDSPEEPATPQLGADTVALGSRVMDAPGYNTTVTRPGYSFVDWYTDDQWIDANKVDQNTLANQPIVPLHAYWVPNGNADYTINHYKRHGGQSTLAEADEPNGRIGTTTPAATPKDYPGYVFDPNTSTLQGVIPQPPDKLELDLYYNPKTVQVTFDPAGGSLPTFPGSGEYDGLLAAPTEPVWAGHKVIGWVTSGQKKWDFANDTLSDANGVTDADQASPQLTLTAVWADGPVATGAKATIGIGQKTTLHGTVTPDTAHNATIDQATVTTTDDWTTKVTFTPGTDGSVVFAADPSLPAGTYQFTVEYTDSNGLTTPASFEVKVVAAPVISTTDFDDVIKEGGTATFNVKVVSEVDVTGKATDVPGAAITAGADGKVEFQAGTFVGGPHAFTVTYTDELGQVSNALGFEVTVQAAPQGGSKTVNLKDDYQTATVEPLKDVTGTNLKPLEESSIVTEPTKGTLALDGSGGLLYTPTHGSVGTDTSTVRVCDNFDQCDDFTYTFDIQHVYVPLAATGDTAVIGPKGTANLEAHLAIDTNVTVDQADVTTQEPWMANATIVATPDGKVTFTAGEALVAGPYTFTVKYTDSYGSTAQAPFTVTVVKEPLVSGKTEKTIPEGGTATFNMQVDSTVTIVGAAVSDDPPGATVTAETDGTVVFKANSLPPATYTFTVTY
ncbi:MAG: hypothetical protein LBK59_00100, partial [Bifidobacteriaceae bacterium]|nr:hypothetical protein [Bifidobacteriaceae bacterium]